MNRVMKIQRMLIDEIDRWAELIPERDQPDFYEKIHAVGSGKIGYLLGLERGLDPELAAIVASCHDYGRIITGKQEGHAEAGEGPVKDFLRSSGELTEDEIETVAKATKNHSKKAEIGSPYEEIAKDADVLDFHQYGYAMPRKDQQDRLDKLLEEGQWKK